MLGSSIPVVRHDIVVTPVTKDAKKFGHRFVAKIIRMMISEVILAGV